MMGSHPKCSVVLCTHNPRREHLSRTLRALAAQSLPREEWDLWVVDNNCDPGLTSWVDLRWHGAGHLIAEPVPGKTHALLNAFRRSTGQLVVIVDDDNELASDYLALAVEIAASRPEIGVFGGSLTGEFEISPPEWIGPYLPGMAVHEIESDLWANLDGFNVAVPYGAGMCARREVVISYAENCRKMPWRTALDRRADVLGSGGDTDIALTALELGLGYGRFARLRLKHLVPAERLTEEYVVRLYAGFAYSAVVRQGPSNRRRRGVSASAWEWCRRWFRWLKADGIERKIAVATWRAQNAAQVDVERGEYGRSTHG